MDATENDIPSQYSVRGYPSLFFAPKNDKENPKKYEVKFNKHSIRCKNASCLFFQGAREVKDFIKYIAKHATVQLNGYDRDGDKILHDGSKTEEL